MMTITVQYSKNENWNTFDSKSVYLKYKKYISDKISFEDFDVWYTEEYQTYLKELLGNYYPIKDKFRSLIKLFNTKDLKTFTDIIEVNDISEMWVGGLVFKDLLYRLCTIYLINHLVEKLQINKVNNIGYYIFKKIYHNKLSLEDIWIRYYFVTKDNISYQDFKRFAISSLKTLEDIKEKYIFYYGKDDLIIKAKPQVSTPKSKSQLFREEVKRKLDVGDTNYLSTKIKLNNRDKYSILRGYGITIPKKKTNFEILHTQWGNTIHELSVKANQNNWTKARLIRHIKKEVKVSPKITTLYYKFKELKNLSFIAEYEYYDMFKKYESKHGREQTLNYFELNTELSDVCKLTENFSFSEIAYITQLPFYKVNSLIQNNLNSLQYKYFRFINSNLTINETFYKVDYESLRYELLNYNNTYFCNKYGIGYSTVSLLRLKFNVYENHSFKEDLLECKNEEEMTRVIDSYSKNTWYSYYKNEIEEIKNSIINVREKEIKVKNAKEHYFNEYKRYSYKVRYMFLLGYSYEEISHKFGISNTMARTIVRKVNLDRDKFKSLCIEKGYHVCYMCHSIRTLDNFHKIIGTNKYRTQCKDCRRVSKTLEGCTSQELQDMYKWFDYKCAYCGEKLDGNTLNVDHIIPRVKGGSNHISNLVISCPYCNSEVKSDLCLDELEINERFTLERKDKILKWIKLNKN